MPDPAKPVLVPILTPGASDRTPTLINPALVSSITPVEGVTAAKQAEITCGGGEKYRVMLSVEECAAAMGFTVGDMPKSIASSVKIADRPEVLDTPAGRIDPRTRELVPKTPAPDPKARPAVVMDGDKIDEDETVDGRGAGRRAAARAAAATV